MENPSFPQFTDASGQFTRVPFKALCGSINKIIDINVYNLEN